MSNVESVMSHAEPEIKGSILGEKRWFRRFIVQVEEGRGRLPNVQNLWRNPMRSQGASCSMARELMHIIRTGAGGECSSMAFCCISTWKVHGVWICHLPFAGVGMVHLCVDQKLTGNLHLC